MGNITILTHGHFHIMKTYCSWVFREVSCETAGKPKYNSDVVTEKWFQHLWMKTEHFYNTMHKICISSSQTKALLLAKKLLANTCCWERDPPPPPTGEYQLICQPHSKASLKFRNKLENMGGLGQKIMILKYMMEISSWGGGGTFSCLGP